MARSTLDSRNPNARNLNQDARNYTSPYEYIEYPKWVRLADGSGVEVNDADEEQAARGEDEPGSESVQPPAGPNNPAPGAPPRKAGRPSKAEIEARARVQAAATGQPTQIEA